MDPSLYQALIARKGPQEATQLGSQGGNSQDPFNAPIAAPNDGTGQQGPVNGADSANPGVNPPIDPEKHSEVVKSIRKAFGIPLGEP